MKNFYKTVSLIVFFAVFGFAFSRGISEADAITPQEIQIKINNLQEQINELLKQLSDIQSTSPAWCHDFNANLKIGDNYSEVAKLKTALMREGIWPVQEPIDNLFSGKLASYVVSFQEKYKSEILDPYGLSRGTGFVGVSTRAKLNQLFSCSRPVQPGSITVLSPNGGEQLRIGETYTIRWITSPYYNTNVNLYLLADGYNLAIASDPYNLGFYNWKIPEKIGGVFLKNLSNFRIAAESSLNNRRVYDISDGYFNIVPSLPLGMVCANVDNVVYSGLISQGGGFWLGFAGFSSYGNYYSDSGWLDNSQVNFGNYPLGIHYMGNVNYGINYSQGELFFQCDGITRTVYLPNAYIVPGNFSTVLYAAFDGSTYYDQALTQPARRN
ncbi:MAG: hypothetical protein PHW72_03080 [Candidatus Pacebacteria bacterium]|nr:hypothetical protein [Candidatus Paceibacterota bacterium]